MHFIFFIIRNVCVQLAKIFMFKLVIFQLTDYIAMQYPVIKYKICKIIFVINNDAFLTCFKAEAFA